MIKLLFLLAAAADVVTGTKLFQQRVGRCFFLPAVFFQSPIYIGRPHNRDLVTADPKPIAPTDATVTAGVLCGSTITTVELEKKSRFVLNNSLLKSFNNSNTEFGGG